MGLREQLNECTDPQPGDWGEITDLSAGSTDRDRKVDYGKFAILAFANLFTALQTFNAGIVSNPTGIGVVGINITQPVGFTVGGVVVNNVNNGSSFGPFIVIGRNNNGTTPAAGFLRMRGKTGNDNDVWVDSSATPGVIRVGNSTTTTNDTAGSVVGAQTSWVEFKEDIEVWDEPQQALDAILAARLFHYHLKGDETKRQYSGLIIHEEDRGAWYSENDGEHQVPALNERNLFGYLIGAIQAQQAQLLELRAEVERLKHVDERTSEPNSV